MSEPDSSKPRIAIVDYGMGNLFSVKHACEHVGMVATITAGHREILNADAVILPGVGAFGDAMDMLRKLDLVSALRDLAASPTPLIGICLGAQLLMSESFEFGRHKGLGIVEGTVARFDNPMEADRPLKVPQVGWNRIYRPEPSSSQPDAWSGTLLERLADGEYMYFVHSYVLQPQDPSVVLSVSRYGHIEFCSSLRHRNNFACQFHPERSGHHGMKVYQNLALIIQHTARGEFI